MNPADPRPVIAAVRDGRGLDEEGAVLIARGLAEGWTGSPTCTRWSADREPFIEGNFPPIAGPLPAGDEYFALFHLNYSDGREILPRRGILQEDPPHEVEHVLMVSRDDCRTWKRVLR